MVLKVLGQRRQQSGVISTYHFFTHTNGSFTKAPVVLGSGTKDKDAHDLVPDAHIKEFHAPMMLTTDIALRMDPA